jgi:hypothetical protein
MSTSNRIIKSGYEFYQPVVAARQFGLGQVPPHFLLRHLTSSRVDLPNAVTTQRCYSLFSDLSIPIPVNLAFISSAVDFEDWWLMWKTHIFWRALGPMLQQIHTEYEIAEGEVLLFAHCFLLLTLLNLSDSIFSFCSRRMAKSTRMMMDLSSGSRQLPLWFSLAKTHLLLRKVSCRSSPAPQS